MAQHLPPDSAAARAAAVAARFPGRFDATELAALEQAIARLEESAAKLRTFPLTNGDEPDPIFRAARPEG
jgi:hypothetical protein